MLLKKTEAVTNTIRSLNMLRESYNTEKTDVFLHPPFYITSLLMIHTFKSDVRLMLLTTIVKRQKDSRTRTRTKRFKIQEHLRAVLQFILYSHLHEMSVLQDSNIYLNNFKKCNEGIPKQLGLQVSTEGIWV